MFIGFFIWIRREPKTRDKVKTKNNKVKGGDNETVIGALTVIYGLNGPVSPEIVTDAIAYVTNLENVGSDIINRLCSFMHEVITHDTIDASKKLTTFNLIHSYIKYVYRMRRVDELIPPEFFIELFPEYINNIYSTMENDDKSNSLYIFLTNISDLANITNDPTFLSNTIPAIVEYMGSNTDNNDAFVALLMSCNYSPDLQKILSEGMTANIGNFVSGIDMSSDINADVINKLSLYVDYVMTYIEDYLDALSVISEYIDAIKIFYITNEDRSGENAGLLERARDLVIRVLNATGQEIPSEFYNAMHIADTLAEVYDNEEESNEPAFIGTILTEIMTRTNGTPDDEVDKLEIVINRLNSVLDIMRDDHVVLVSD